VKMFRIIALAFAIARSSAYAYEDDHWEDDHHDDHHDEYTPWEFIFPDECNMGKWSVINWDMGVDGVEEWWSSRDEVMAYCEDHVGCDTAACEEKNVLDHDHCERLKYGDLRERYENEVIYANHDERISFITVVNIMCGNADISCAYASSGVGWSLLLGADHGPAQDYCWQYCHSSEMDRGIDDFVDPCSTELWDVMEGDDHWDHWDDDDHWDHWDDDDHHDDHNDNPYDLWNILMSSSVDGCQEAKWYLSNYRNGHTDGADGMSEYEMVERCEDQCDGHNSCNRLKPEDFLNHDACQRIMHGDLKELYEYQVLDAKDFGEEGDQRRGMMSLMNVMCGNMEIECAYAAFEFWDSVRDGRNIFEKLAEAVESPEMKKCREKCKGQMWDKGFDDMVKPCGSLFNSLSIAILFIISLVR